MVLTYQKQKILKNNIYLKEILKNEIEKILGLTALAAIATFALAACGSSNSSSKDGETTVKVGVMTLSDTEKKLVGIKFKRTWMTLKQGSN